MIISGWWVSSQVVKVIQGEAEINVYLDEKNVNTNTGAMQMVERIKGIEGVRELAAALTAFAIKYLYAQMAGPLSFIPLPPREALVSSIVIVVMSLSAVLGIGGSILGLSSSKSN